MQRRTCSPPTPWRRRLVVAVLFLQVAVPLIALNNPPTRFGFQMYSGITSTGIEVRDRAGRVVELDEDLLPGPLRGDLPWWRDLPEFICAHQDSAHVVAVATAEGQEWLVPC